MCGIVGVAGTEYRADGAVLDGARDLLTHRGPDDAGTYVSPDSRVGLAFRRLSIIDLSRDAGQPMPNEDESAWLVFNGEIYNSASLRAGRVANGHRFRSEMDGEVILHLYEEMGPALVDHLSGMFAFGLWDQRGQRVLLARDRLGIKPLYYSWDGRRLLFASELRSILAFPGVKRRIDEQALADYLTYGYVPHDRCIVAGVQKLPAAHMLTLDLRPGAQPRIEAYWDVDYSGSVKDLGEATAMVGDRLSASVNEQLVSDVPLGLFLSGGVDSTSVLAQMASYSDAPVNAYAIDFDASTSSEVPYARLAAETFGAEFASRQVRVGDADAAIELMSEVYDEPLLDYSTIPTYHVSQLAADHVKVVLSGDGGDEVFGGYNRYPAYMRIAERRRRSRGALPAAAVAFAAVLPGLRQLPYAARLAILERSLYRGPVEGYFRHIGLFDGWELKRLLGAKVNAALDGHDPLWLLRHFYRDDYPEFAALRYLDLKTYLPDDILVKVDRASMACSLEVRPPLLDHRLVELAFDIDDGLMMDEHGGKRVLREAMRGTVPEPILQRSKKGFGSPIRTWLRGGMGESVVDGMRDWTIVEAGLVRPEFVRGFMRNGAFNRYAKLWSLIVLESWHRRWIANAAPEPLQTTPSASSSPV